MAAKILVDHVVDHGSETRRWYSADRKEAEDRSKLRMDLDGRELGRGGIVLFLPEPCPWSSTGKHIVAC